MIEVLQQFRRVTPDTPLLPYYEAFAHTRRYPRMFMAPLLLGTKSEFTWGIVDGCLCVMKRRVMFKSIVMYLILPPMHLEGDIVTERAVLRRFYKAGIGVYLSEEDVALYHVGNKVEPVHGNAEFVYRAGDLADLAGRRNKVWRKRWNQLEARYDVQTYNVSMAMAMPDIRCISKAWREHRNASSAHSEKIVAEFTQYARAWKTWGFTISRDGCPCAFSVSQQVAPSWVCLLVGLHSFSSLLLDSCRMQHLLKMKYWCAELGPESLLNMGAAVGRAKLETAKQHLRPTRIMQIYALRSPKRLTLDDYHRSKQLPEKRGFFA
jgi:hypothetical protein